MADFALAAGCGCDLLTDGKRMMPVTQAIGVAHGLVRTLATTELVRLAEAAGRIAARDLHAPRAMPFFDNSAMDGFAVRTCDFQGTGPWTLPVVGPVSAGESHAGVTPADRVAIRIFTGAPVPEGFDAVVMQEYVETSGSQACFSLKPVGGQNVRIAGEDVKRGAVLISAGSCLESRHLGLLAANGYAAVNVIARPRIGVFSTGDELVEPGRPIGPAQMFDANRALLLNLAAATGAVVDDLGTLPDDCAITTAFFTRNLGRYDLLVSSGAVSVGDKDLVKPAFEQAGGRLSLWKVAMKPGKPVMFGSGKGTVFTGLPGNSFAAYVGFKLFIDGMIARLQCQEPKQFADTMAIADFDWSRTPGRTEYFPVKLTGADEPARPRITRLGHGGSASLYPLSQADGVAAVAADISHVKPGDELLWHRFA